MSAAARPGSALATCSCAVPSRSSSDFSTASSRSSSSASSGWAPWPLAAVRRPVRASCVSSAVPRRCLFMDGPTSPTLSRPARREITSMSSPMRFTARRPPILCHKPHACHSTPSRIPLGCRKRTSGSTALMTPILGPATTSPRWMLSIVSNGCWAGSTTLRQLLALSANRSAAQHHAVRAVVCNQPDGAVGPCTNGCDARPAARSALGHVDRCTDNLVC